MVMFFRVMIVTGFVLFAGCAGVSTTATKNYSPDNQSNASLNHLPLDSNITTGTLPNGLRYYIRKNSEPQNRAELRLGINAGSILEDDDQRGLAHFVEHLAFNGTENFPKQTLVDYLESIGMRFGPDLNAYTSFDETVYMLQIPTDSAAIVETAFRILSDWAHNIRFSPEEVEKERGVIVEEWRLGRGANARMLDKQFPILFHESKYAERLPIGKKEIIETADVETIRRFYRDWYRADMMAVVAVGDFDVAQIEALIREHFAPIPASENPRKRQEFPVPDHAETLFSTATDPEATYTSISVYYKKPVEPENSLKSYRQNLVKSLHNSILNNRLNELLQQPEPPFLYAGVGEGRFVRTKSFFSMTAVVKDNELPTGLAALLTEARRIREFGVTPGELDRQKSEMLRGIEQAYRERDKSGSANYAAEYLRNFFEDEPIPGIAYEYELWQQYIPEISLAEVNAVAGELLDTKNRVVLINAPEKDGLNLPDESELQSVFEAVQNSDIEPYADNVSDEPLISTLPAPGDVVQKIHNDSLDVHEWQLSNGMRIFAKTTDFKNDQVLFRAFSPGGLSLYPDSVYIAGETAASVVAMGGIGNFDRIELEKKLAGKNVSVSPGINNMSEGISGGASPEDLETMFQLIHLYFTAPRMDSTAYLAYQAQIRGFLANRAADPETAFSDTVQVTMSDYHFRTRPWSDKLLQEMDLQKSYQIFRERFANAGDFTFIFVGNIDLLQLESLAETYLASLPATGDRENWRDEQIETPTGNIEKTLHRGLEEKAQVEIYFNGSFNWDRGNRLAIQAMASVLQIKLRETLREDQGGTYGVGVSASTSHYPESTYEIRIAFGCAPDRVNELTQLVFEQIDSLKTVDVDPQYLQKVQESLRRENEINLRRNGYWLSTLQFYLWNAENPNNILQTPSFIGQLSVEGIRAAAQQYFSTPNVARFQLLPTE